MSEAPTTNGAQAGDFDMKATKTALTSSSTAARIHQLRLVDEKLSQKVLDRPSTLAILKTLFWTHAFYNDRPSRQAVQRCLVTLAKAGETEILTPLVGVIKLEAQKSGIASSSAFVLAEWCSLLMQNLAGTPPWEKFGNDIVLAYANALEICQQPTSKGGLPDSALVIARRGFRKLVAASESKEKVITSAVQALTTKGTQPTAKNAVLLGVIAGVCSRNVDAKAVLSNLKPSYFTFYTREILGSRTAVPEHLAGGLDDFFSAFASLEDLEKDVFPAIEKGLLRAPEVVLSLIKPLVHSLPEEFDLSKSLCGRLMKPFLSNVKSSNAVIRSGAVSAFKEVVTGCRDFTELEKVADEILGPLKTGKLASPDHRVLHSEMLVALPMSTSIASKIATGLPALLAKESNEAALGAETLALTKSVIDLLPSDAEVPKTISEAYVKGLADKKPPFRRIWILRAGEILEAFNKDQDLPPSFTKFAESIFPPLLDIFAEVDKNPIAAAQSGLVTAAFVISSVASLLQRSGSNELTPLAKKFAVQKQSLTLDPKPSFLLNPRIFGKLQSDDDFKWLYRALSALAPAVTLQGSVAVQTAWAEAFIYLISSSHVPPTVHRDAANALADTYARSEGVISKFIVDGLWHWVESLETGDKDSAAFLAKADLSALYLVLKAICLSPKDYSTRAGADVNKKRLEAQMTSLLVLARPEIIPRAKWIELCLSVELDPGELARNYEQELIDEVVARTSYEQKSQKVRDAASMAAAELVFVSSETMSKRILELIRQDLDAAEVKAIGPLEAAIFRTPEGTAFVDVLAKKPNQVPDKNQKDYDTLKWEEELRAQLAAKKGTQKKLTAEEQSKVNAQLKRESAIRENVRHVAGKLLRGFGVVKALATGPPTEVSAWLGTVVKYVLAAIDAGACQITAETGPMAFIACSDRVAPRLGSIRPFIGVATLRAHEVDVLPENLVEEPFEDLVTRVLYRLRFTSEQRPFDAVSLIYVLPLLLLVLAKGCFGATGDDRDAQIVLAVEILSFHTDICADEAVPRDEILSSLIFAMQTYNQHYKIIKDCFADMVRCIAPNMTLGEIAVLVKGAIVPETSVRTTVLQSISAEVDMSELDFSEEIWLAFHDDFDDNRDLAQEIWEESEFATSDQVPAKMLPYLESKDAQLRRAAARSLGEVTRLHPTTLQDTLDSLRSSYTELAKPRVPQLDEFGMPRKMDLSDPWEARHGIALAFKETSPHLPKPQLEPFFNFLIENGPLGDQNGTVRGEMLEAANAAIELHGKGILDKLMTTFEHTLEGPDKNSEAADRVNEAVIIMYGALARHLKPADKKIAVVIERLLETLSTPSETVQYAIAECLPPLVRISGDKSSKYFDQILETMLTSKKYAEQRGAAYGLAGLVKGRGIQVLREYRIMITLRGKIIA